MSGGAVKASGRLSVLDSVRGLLLVQMTLDHLGMPFNYWLYQCFGFFTAAEGFFFLSGLVGAWAARRKLSTDATAAFLRKRARTLWLAQVGSVLGFATFVVISGITPPYGFAEFVEHPLQAIVATMALVHTPGWFDVLSLYTVLLWLASWGVAALAQGKKWPLLVSTAIWLLAQFGLREAVRDWLPAWSAAGTFDPFAWQWIYMLGASAALLLAPGKLTSARVWLVLAALVALFGLAWSRRWLPLAQPSDFWVSRNHLGLLRVLDFGAWALLVAWVVRYVPAWLDFRPTALLGRQSLSVFVWQSLLVQFWFLAPRFWHHSPWDAVGSLLALATIWIPAILLERRRRRGSG